MLFTFDILFVIPEISKEQKKIKTTHFTTLMTYLHMQCRPPSSDGSVLRKCTNETTIKQKTMHESHCQLNTTPIDMTCNENRFFISDHLNYTAILVVFFLLRDTALFFLLQLYNIFDIRY